MHIDNRLTLIALVLSAILASGCSSIPVGERENVRSEINALAVESLADFVAHDPSLQEEIDQSAGYFVGSGETSLLILASSVDSVGVLYDRGQQTRTYLNIDEFGVGAGLGSADFELLLIIKSNETLQQMKKGKWIPSADVFSMAGESENLSKWVGDDMSVYIRSESGAAAGANLRLARVSVNPDLTDTGISDYNFPNHPGPKGIPKDEDAPRVWPYKLPFLAQRVIDKGFDLPLPYGAGWVYADLSQDMELTNMYVGFNGGEKRQFAVLSLENSVADTKTNQFKMDTWILPFMNVFVIVGKVDGSADLDVLLDGNAILEDRETDCSGIPRPPLCSRLENRSLTVPVVADVTATNFGFGTILAGGWNGWIAALPMTYTVAVRDGSVTVGSSITASPRIGRAINLGNLGNLTLFGGASYLKTDYTIDGTFVVPGDVDLTLDYTIDQDNTDPWNLLLGFNWDVSKRWSWTLEYDGFTGSRTAFITAINIRF
jgi:hypothetical protein